MIYIIILLGIVIGILCYLLGKKVIKDKETEKENQKLKEQNKLLHDVENSLSKEIERYDIRLLNLKEQEDMLNKHKNEIANINDQLTQNEKNHQKEMNF